MKGIILAGGSGTRLYPLTTSISKQILPVYDKPMIYYPLSVLMAAGITKILIISTPRDLPSFKGLLGDGCHLGISITYAEQPKPEGLAQAFIIGEEFIGEDNVSLILGDNIFYGYRLPYLVKQASVLKEGGIVFGYSVKDPERYGVIDFDTAGRVTGIEEKPQKPKSSYAVTGLYFYDNTVIEKAKSLTPSKRQELEITDINKLYLSEGKLKVELLGKGMAWLDTGQHDALLQASNFIASIEKRQGIKVACLEEIAYREGLIDERQLADLAAPLLKTQYGKYLMHLLDKKASFVNHECY
ncbi:glucose-1-phosphate thymidylyltransferase RfbA [Fulvivirgaceae bacterium BMA12]|uniref:Glucose-1-phosphate thymidylyltransferase n=1 Tax=Agaribacillus aureus TaxID=3051825 RepID=A0ABT8L1Q3_9BACT|nr:glucose-1-phosphate thymidylyltransferase RfbA [Fulvivirgaceae bacterium BMA12]